MINQLKELFGGGKKNYTDLDGETFTQVIKADPDAVVIDVRTKAEYNSGHIPKAKNIDIMSGGFEQQIEKLDKQKSYYLYCRSGGRSSSAAAQMSSLGFNNVFNLAGGIGSYKGRTE
jgi:rhodanese-related sulfurtransferase